jgi:hypothetical protein
MSTSIVLALCPRSSPKPTASAAASTLGHSLRTVPGITQLRELSSAQRHAGGTGALRPDPNRYRGRSGDAARQAPTVPELSVEIGRMMRGGPRLPLVGGQAHPRRAKRKPKPFLRRKTSGRLRPSARLPLVGESATSSECKPENQNLPNKKRKAAAVCGALACLLLVGPRR